MHSRLTAFSLVILFAAAAQAATPVDDFPPSQRWRADDDDFQEIDDPYLPSGKPEWLRTTGGTWSTWRDNALDGLKSAVDRTDSSGKNHYNISIPATLDKTVAVWKVRVRYAGENTPILKVRCDNPDPLKSGYRVRLNFSRNLNPGTCLVTSGWMADDGATATSGGLVNTTDGKRYLPMPFNEWHTLRVELDPVNGTFTAWLDPEKGFSDRARISGPAGTNTANEIKFCHTETKSGVNEAATNCFAWAQGTAIPPFTEGPFEYCTNGIDDDGDGLADNADPQCAFTGTVENTQATCSDGIDNDCDGLSDCADPDCAGIWAENDTATCSDGKDNDCDGIIDCDDPDCAAIAHCGQDQPFFALSLVRQLGDWQNTCYEQGGGYFCSSGVFFSVYDDNGNPLNDVVLTDPLNAVSVTTQNDPGQGTDGQGGHARYVPAQGLANKTYRFYVSSYNAAPVASEMTPDFYAWVGPHNPMHSWQVEFMLKSHRYNPVSFSPQDPTYLFDNIDMNTPPGPNDTLFSGDRSDLSGPGGVLFGQTFVATGDRIVSLRVRATNVHPYTLQYEASIHPLLRDPPTSMADVGPPIGPARRSPANMHPTEWWTQMLLWPVEGEDSVPVNPGQKYFLKVIRTDTGGYGYPGFNVFSSTSDFYANGQRFRSEDGNTLVTDAGFYDLVAYVVAATIGPPNYCLLHNPVFDVNDDRQVDASDLVFFEACATAAGAGEAEWQALSDACKCMDRNRDQSVDQIDFSFFQRCLTVPGIDADVTCDD